MSLNEVYDNLVFHELAGSVVGWVLGNGKENRIDFGLFDGDRERVRAFVNANENCILLDFNVDGVIYEVFTKEKV